MAAIGNTYQTYQNVGIREELADVIYNISPEETPFLSSAAKDSADNTYYEWQQDALQPPVANAQLEGDDITVFDAAVPTVRLGNWTQISRKTAIVAGTTEKVNRAGRKSEMAYQLSKKSAELKRDMESGLLSNQAGTAGSSSTPRKYGSLLAFLKTNVSMGTGGANPTSAIPSTARTNGTARAVSEPLLRTVLQSCFVAGGAPKTIMVGPQIKQEVSQTFQGIGTRFLDVKAAPMPVVNAVDVYVSDFGKLSVVPNRFMRTDALDMLLLDWEYIKIPYLRPFQQIELAKTGDAEKRMLLVEYGLKVLHEGALGLVTDLS